MMEKENLAVRLGVVRPSQERIDRYVDRLNFTSPVSRGIDKALFPMCKQSPATRVKLDADVQMLVNHLKSKLGATWFEARRDKPTCLVNPPKSPKVWDAVKRSAVGGDFRAWVCGHLDSKVTWI